MTLFNCVCESREILRIEFTVGWLCTPHTPQPPQPRLGLYMSSTSPDNLTRPPDSVPPISAPCQRQPAEPIPPAAWENGGGEGSAPPRGGRIFLSEAEENSFHLYVLPSPLWNYSEQLTSTVPSKMLLMNWTMSSAFAICLSSKKYCWFEVFSTTTVGTFNSLKIEKQRSQNTC